MESIGYGADGEASDWMLSAAGVIAMSPELGSASVQSATFDIASPKEEAEIMIMNMGLPDELIRRTHSMLVVEPVHTVQALMNRGILAFEVKLHNKGMSKSHPEI